MKVSVAIITYNHEAFISQALESVLMQQVNFDYEIVLGDDCSTDSTRNIAIGYQQKYPDKIRLLQNESNLGASRNLVSTIEACQGQYIALLEGDDYWICQEKLQKQVDYLDRHPECAMCFADCLILYEDNSQESSTTQPTDQTLKEEIFDLEDFLANKFLWSTCTAIYRRGIFGEFPKWYCSELRNYGDRTLWTLIARHGKIGIIHEVMGVYRVHSGGVWSGASEIQALKNGLHMAEVTFRYCDLNLNCKRLLSQTIYRYSYNLSLACEKNGNLKEALEYARRSLGCLFTRKPQIPRKALIWKWFKLNLVMLFQ
jgi:glycosyltransferase involved in cell wall biosynthesis